MADKIGKSMLVLGLALTAWLLVTIEGFLYVMWAVERDSACQLEINESCALAWLPALVAGGFFGIEALVGMLVAGALAATGSWIGTRIAAYSLVGVLVLEHVWLLF